MDETTSELVDLAVARLSKIERPTKADIRELATRFNVGYGFVDDTLEQVITEIETRIFISMPKGDAVVRRETRRRWLAARRAEIDFLFWKRYAKYLQFDREMAPNVVKTLDESLDEILELLGDPQDQQGFFRRGLIVGDVQSGKTATYIGLCCKAADAGYKIIILLAGHMNSLRYQTQERFDEGLAGRDSKLVGSVSGVDGLFGSAKYNPDLAVHAYTTKLHDFDTQSARAVGSPLAGLRGPAILVVKKNKTILRNMYLWLKSLNPIQQGKIHSSLLLIDDEADFASVNTGPEYEPKAINAGIRQLLDLFEKASYVGVTATPFANVFIAPDSTDAMYGGDLFPSDYIYSLEPPSNYVGAPEVFEYERETTVREIDDAEPIIPLKHRKDLIIDSLPASLVEAVDSFLLSNAIRDLRAEGPTHRSMLVNVSPMNAVQRQVTELLRKELDRAKREIFLFGTMSSTEATTQSEVIARLQDTYRRIYSSEVGINDVTWDEVLARLHNANREVVVQTVNMAAKSGLNYEQSKEDGLRVIVVGGHSLSRGLTLEGLCVSYFHRNSKAYDTLLQMGRWFGYRRGYRDLCRIYMTQEAVGNFQFISDAVSDLKAQFQRMREIGATPSEFGLKVRASPAGLMMTAAAKMKTAERLMVGTVSLSAQRLEATELDSSRELMTSNEAAVIQLINSLGPTATSGVPNSVRYYWPKQNKSLITEFLDRYRVHPIMFSFRPGEIAEYLRNSSLSSLEDWDVCIREGSEAEIEMYGLSIRPSRRSLTLDPDVKNLFTIGERRSRRLGSSEDDMIGMSEAELVELESRRDDLVKAGKPAKPGPLARQVRKEPLLSLYLIKAQQGEKNYIPELPHFTSISLTFPWFKDSELPETQIMLVNPIWMKYQEGLQADLDEDDAEMNQQ